MAEMFMFCYPLPPAPWPDLYANYALIIILHPYSIVYGMESAR